MLLSCFSLLQHLWDVLPLCTHPILWFFSFKADDKKTPQNTQMKFKTNKQNTNKTKIANRKQNETKQRKVHFVLANWPWAGDLSETLVNIPHDMPLERTWFPFTQVSFANSSCLGTGPLPPLSVGPLSDLTLCRSCACCQSLWVQMCVSLYAWEVEDIHL